ncbi:MAG: hypothetical protein MZU84_07790 [Sphingobacterium sp.]|nr:hypothetical protein [Sphingobacterium sp.]
MIQALQMHKLQMLPPGGSACSSRAAYLRLGFLLIMIIRFLIKLLKLCANEIFLSSDLIFRSLYWYSMTLLLLIGNMISQVFVIQQYSPFNKPDKGIEPLKGNEKLTQKQIESMPLPYMSKLVVEDIGTIPAFIFPGRDNGIGEKRKGRNLSSETMTFGKLLFLMTPFLIILYVLSRLMTARKKKNSCNQ